MYWNPYASPLEFRPQPSRQLTAFILLGHIAAAVCLAACGAGYGPPAVVVCLAPFTLRRAIAPCGGDVVRITWCPRRGWGRETRRGQYIPMELMPSSVVTTGALFLHWTDERGAWRVCLPGDALDEDAFRRLTVLARFHDAGRTHC